MYGKKLGDVPVLVAEAIAIGETFRIVGYRNMDKILNESNSHFVNNSIKGLIKIPNQINNHVIDIVNQVRNLIISNSITVIDLKILSRMGMQRGVTVVGMMFFYFNEIVSVQKIKIKK